MTSSASSAPLSSPPPNWVDHGHPLGRLIDALLAEAARLLRPGGVIALVDQDPGSAVIRRLPAPIATLLKSTEPYLEEYFRLDLPAALEQAGFQAVRAEACDPRHRVLVARR